MRFLLFSFLLIVLWMPQKAGEAKKGSTKGGEAGQKQLPHRGRQRLIVQ